MHLTLCLVLRLLSDKILLENLILFITDRAEKVTEPTPVRLSPKYKPRKMYTFAQNEIWVMGEIFKTCQVVIRNNWSC